MDSALARFFGDGREEEEKYILGIRMIWSMQYHMQPVVHDATKAKQMLMWKGKTQKCGSCIQYLAGKKQENLALSAFILEGNIGWIN